jgi:hypothetical protein
MTTLTYTVSAHRWSDAESHTYIVGVYSKESAALKAAGDEEEYRGGKYKCEVIEWEVDNGCEASINKVARMVKER